MRSNKCRIWTSPRPPMRGASCLARYSSRTQKVNISSLSPLLDTLIDEVGEDESHPLASLMEVVGILIEKEDEHVPELAVE